MCVLLEIIQAGNKGDIIERIIKQKDDEKKIYEDEKVKYIYKYSNMGFLISKYKNIKEAAEIERLDADGINDSITEKNKKYGGFIWRDENTEFTSEYIKLINKKNTAVIIKIDKNGKEIKKYNTINDVCKDNKISRNILARLCRTGDLKDGYKYKRENEDNVVIHLKKRDKAEILSRYNAGVKIEDLAMKYKKTKKYLKILINKMNENIG